MEKYPKIRRIGDHQNEGILSSPDEHLTLREKLDGANFRFTYDAENDRLVFGSRNIEYWNDGNQPIDRRTSLLFKLAPYLNKIEYVNVPESPQDDVDKSFQHAIDYIRENIDMGTVRSLHEVYGPITFFGEAMHSHTIDYDWEDTPNFLGFDIYFEDESKFGRFASDDDMERIFGRLNLEVSPALPLDELEDPEEFEAPSSEFHDGPAEGVVLKNDETGQRAKVRGEKFREVAQINKSSSGDSTSDNEIPNHHTLANKFATEARIIKTIHKMEDRGRVIEMSLMEDLWREVFDDIMQEEYETIFLGRYRINTKEFRSAVASQTANVLQQYISRPDDSVLNQ